MVTCSMTDPSPRESATVSTPPLWYSPRQHRGQGSQPCDVQTFIVIDLTYCIDCFVCRTPDVSWYFLRPSILLPYPHSSICYHYILYKYRLFGLSLTVKNVPGTGWSRPHVKVYQCLTCHYGHGKSKIKSLLLLY